MKNTIFFALGASICFGLWPVIARKSGANGNVINIYITCITLVVAMAWILVTQKGTLKFHTDTSATLCLIAAGCINGFGIIFYGALLGSNSPSAGLLNVVATIGIPIFLFIFGWLLLKEQINVRQMTGIAIAAIGIYLVMNPKK